MQIAVDEETGEIVAVSESVLEPTADIKLLEQTKLLDPLPQQEGLLARTSTFLPLSFAVLNSKSHQF